MNILKEKLIEMSEDKYREFAMKLLPDIDNVLGVRLPFLRKTAKEFARGDWRTVLQNIDNEYFEEKLVECFVIAYAKMDYDERMSYIEAFLPKIDCWSVCDSFCTTLKFTEKNKDAVLDYLKSKGDSKEEYVIRFVAVMLLNYYINEEYLDEFFKLIDRLHTEKYYAHMAVAWALSIAYIKFPRETEKFLTGSGLDDATYNKTLQKIRESNRISKEEKEYIKGLKRG